MAAFNQSRQVIWEPQTNTFAFVPTNVSFTLIPSVYHPAGERGAPRNMGTINLPVNLEKPLNLKRTQVVEKLEANLKKEREEREAAEKRESDARAEFQSFIDEHQDQIINYLRACISGGSSWKGTLDQAEEVFKNDAYATKESKPGRLESELEKFVRVLKMTADDTIEVTPTQAVYDLL